MFSLQRIYYSLALAVIFVGFSCSLQDSVAPQQGSELKLIAEYDLPVSEPSGLSLNNDNSALWTVSDNTNRVYKISLEGQPLQELRYEGNDLEGIVFDSADNTLWLAEEQLREIVHIDLNGNELSRHAVNLPGTGNSGLEGICLDSLHTHYVLNEKDPRLWAKLKNDFSVSLQQEINDVEDLSGISYDKNRKMFWIVSDQSRLLFLWGPEMGVVKSFDLSFEKAEGVSYNPHLDRIYIVSDKTEKLYIYDLQEIEKSFNIITL